MSEGENNVLDLGSIDFTPAWAKQSAGVNVGKVRPERDFGEKKAKGEGEGRRGEKRQFGDRKPFGDKKPFGERRQFGDRKPRFVERPKPLDAEIKVLPETKALGTIIRKLQGDFHAYKLKDLAYFFLDNPESVLLKVVPRPPADGTVPVKFFQCKVCGFASTREEDVVVHALAVHLADYYDEKEIDCDPPKGNFNCIAKCGLSGVLLGPPNIHEFNSVVKEMIRTKYPDMSEEQYRSHIEMVRDADTIEEWRKRATRKTVFFAKGTADQEGAQGYSREQVEGEFRRTILPSLTDEPKHLMITADQAMKSPLKPLQWAVQDALDAERRSPYGMCFALRGAFHHRKLHFFRTNDSHGQEFVSGIEYHEFDNVHAIPELVAVAKFVEDHPCCDKSELPQDPETLKHLEWLASTGHVVAFTNGVYSKVEKFPKYGPQWKKRPAVAKAKDEGEGQGTEAKVEGQGQEVEAPKVELVAESNNQTIKESNNETSPVMAE